MDTPPLPTPSVPPPVLNSSDKLWAVFCHLATLLGVGIVLPLIVYLVMKADSRYVAANAREALNFQISVVVYSLCCIPLVFIVVGLPILMLIGVGAFILAILAAIKASEGDCYRYPLTIRLVR